MDESLSKAPKQIILCGRNPKYDILLEDSRVYFGMGGTPTPFIRDLETGENRRPTKKDFADATRLGDALPNMSFIMSIAGAFDVPYEVEYEHEWEALFNNTEKPIVYSAPSAYSARKVLEMGAAVARGHGRIEEAADHVPVQRDDFPALDSAGQREHDRVRKGGRTDHPRGCPNGGRNRARHSSRHASNR